LLLFPDLFRRGQIATPIEILFIAPIRTGKSLVAFGR
jgi:hypothetical protein